MAGVTFYDWWRREENQQHFWRISKTGVAVSLGETPRYIFWQILQLLKGYHDREVGYGNLLEGVLIGENKQVQLSYYDQPNAGDVDAIKQDFLDFKELVSEVEELIRERQGVKPAYSSTKFHDLYGLLDHYSNSVDGLRHFGFFMRNSPLFLDDTAKYLFFKKVLTIKEYDVLKFQTAIELRDLEGWAEDVDNEHLVAVKKYKGGKHKEKPHQSADNSTSESANKPTSQSTADNSTNQHLVAVKKYKGGKHKEKPHQSADNSTSESADKPTSQSADTSTSQHLVAVKKYKGGKHKEKLHQSADNSTSQSADKPTSQSADNSTSQHLVAVKKYEGGKHKEKPHQSADNSTSESADKPTSQSADNSTSQHLVAVKKYKGGKHKEKPHQSADNSTSEIGGSHGGGNLTSRSGKGKNKLGQSGPTNQSGGNTPSRRGNPTNQSIYEKPDGSISFFRNCLGHMREHNGGTIYHDAKILHVLEDDLPKVIPVWFYDLVRELGLNIQKCADMCGGCSWMEFLSMQPTVFT